MTWVSIKVLENAKTFHVKYVASDVLYGSFDFVNDDEGTRIYTNRQHKPYWLKSRDFFSKLREAHGYVVAQLITDEYAETWFDVDVQHSDDGLVEYKDGYLREK